MRKMKMGRRARNNNYGSERREEREREEREKCKIERKKMKEESEGNYFREKCGEDGNENGAKIESNN